MNTYKVIGKGYKGQVFKFFVEAESELDARAAIREWLSGSEVLSGFTTSAQKATEVEISNANRILVARRVGA